MANNNLILIAPARRTGAAHSRVGDGTARVSDMKEKIGRGVLRSIANGLVFFQPSAFFSNFRPTVGNFQPAGFCFLLVFFGFL